MPIISIAIFTFLKNINIAHYKNYLLHPLILPAIISFFLISSYFSWWGGWCYGPRHLIAISIILSYEAIPYIIRKGYSKFVLFSILAVSVIITFATKITAQYALPSNIKNPFTQIISPALINKNYNNNNILSQVFNVNNITSSYFWGFLFLISVILLYIFSSIKNEEI